jgi:hypothetical protein
MAKQSINIGTAANDGTGDPLRTAFDKINDNFTELYGADDDATNFVIEDTTPQLGGDLDVNGQRITSARSNEDIIILPNGTGGVIASAIRIAGTTLSSDDSASITVAEALQINGATNIDGAVTATSTMAVTGATTLSSTLAVTGATTMLAGLTATSLTTNDIVSNGSNADITLDPTGTGDINLTAGADVNIPANIGLTFGDDGEKIEGNGTNLTIASSGTTTITSTGSTDITNAASVGGTLAVTGAMTLTNTLTARDITTNNIQSNGSNADISIQANGTGNVVVGALTLNGTAISSADSTLIQLNEAVNISGALDVAGAMTTIGQTITGNVSITGATTFVGAIGVGDLNILADGTITTDSNGDFVVDPAGTGAIVLTGPITATGVQTTTGQLNVDNLRADGNTLSATDTNGSVNITPNGSGSVVLGGEIVGVTNELNATDIEVSGVLRSNTIQSDTTDADINISSQGTGVVGISSQLTLTGSFLPAIHTFVATDAVTITEHAGRTLLLGEVGGNAALTLTLPAATGTGAVYKFIVSVTNTSNYKIQVADATDTIDGIMMYLDEDGTAVSAFPTVTASDTITLNGGTQGGIIGDYLELIDIATNQYHVRGVMRVAAGANPATPFSAAVS